MNKYEEFKQKYEELKDNPMYQNFCSILDTKSQMLERMSKENQELKQQQKEFIEWLRNESKELIRDAGYHQRICLEILSKYKEIIGGKDDNK